ncbi:MAG: superinfection exclusion B family protein [Acidobacteriia bacterium]|nr:superinfection exclusion B family protein [Terriglobia bacterium]
MATPSIPIVETIAKIISTVLNPRIAVTIFIVSGIALAVPIALPGAFPWLDSLVLTYKAIAAITCLASGVLSISYLSSHFWKVWSHNKHVGRRKKCVHERLEKLTVHEKHMLQYYLCEDSRTVHFDISDGNTGPLLRSGILQPGAPYTNGAVAAFNITDEAWDYLREHMHLIETPNKPRPSRGSWTI